MNKAKSIAAGVLSLSAVAMTNAQQLAKRITNTSTETIIELFTIRNGTSLTDVVGQDGFDPSTSPGVGAVSFVSADTTKYFDSAGGLPGGSPTVPNEVIGNDTFQTQSSGEGTFTTYTDTQGSSATFNINVPVTVTNRDAISDGNTNTDLLSFKANLKKTLNDGSPIPQNTRAVIQSRGGKDLSTGLSMPGSRRLCFQFIGNTWEERATDRLGVACSGFSSETVLGNEEFERTINSKVIAYPNPTNDNITLDNGDQIDNEFKFEIYNITGKKIGQGENKEGQKINLENLTSGNYIIMIQDEDGKKQNTKIIKN